MSRRRAGFTFIELLIGLVVTAIVAGAMIRLIMTDLRFAEDREAWRTARQAARGGFAMLTADLRMVETTGGVEAASADGKDLTVRIPYAIGVLCATNGSTSTVSLMPVDSAMYAQTGHSGFAWRNDTTAAYTYVGGGTRGSGSAIVCTLNGIQVVTGGTVVSLTGAIPSARPVGTVLFLYRRIRYELKASTQMVGQTALWRTPLSSGTGEELAAPFASTARFRYYVGTTATPQETVPSPLSSMTGLELAFDGQSDRTPRMSTTGPKVVQFSSSLFFQNVMP